MTKDELLKEARTAKGKSIDEIETPALVVDLDIMEANMDKMMAFLREGSGGIRPHAKSHKVPQVALMQIEKGALGICCAKVGEAEAMADGGVGDILITSQVTGAKRIRRAAKLAGKTDLKVAVDSAANVKDLSAAAVEAGNTIGIVIECEVGNDRCGVRRHSAAVEIAKLVTELPGLRFYGIMGYEGHCVFTADFEERRAAANKAYDDLFGFRDVLAEAGYECSIVSTGGTGTYRFGGRREGITDIEAGSYIYMDTRYGGTSGIDFKQSMAVLSSIISHPTDDLWVSDAGLKSMTKEFGMVSILSGYGLKVLHMSEEHINLVPADEPEYLPGWMDMSDKYAHGPRPFDIGSKVLLVPSHCCTTSNLHDFIYAIRDGKVEDVWPITGRGRFD